jgi:hypothetical protein
MAFLQNEQEVALHLLVTKTTIGLLLINARTLDSVAITRLINAAVISMKMVEGSLQSTAD